MEELFHIIETKGDATNEEILNGINKEHHMLGLMPPFEVSIRLRKIIQDLKNIKPIAIHDRLQFYTLILVIILFPGLDNFVSFSFNLRNERILFIFVTYTLRKQLELPIETISQIFYESIPTFSYKKSFYEIKPIYFYQRVPELLKGLQNTDSKEFVKVFLDSFMSVGDLSNIDHSTIIFFNGMIQQCISYLIREKDDKIVNQCQLFFTRIFSLQTVCPSIILLHFLHLWYIFVRFCREKDIKLSYEPQTHLISFLFKSISSSQRHELYRFFHWNLVLTIRAKFEGSSWDFNTLCLILTFYKTIYHIELMRDMVNPSREFLDQTIEQSKGKNKFSFCTILAFFDSCLRDYIKSISEFFLIVINSNSEELQQSKIKPLKITFLDQLKCSKSNNSNPDLDLLDNYLYTIMNEKTIELSEFSLQFDSLITRCELMKTRMITASYFLFPCFKRAVSNIEFLPYLIHITKSFMNVVIHINQAIFSIQYINVTPNKNPEMMIIINGIKDTLKETPVKIAPYITNTIAQQLFRKCKKFKITRLTIDFLCSLSDHLLNLLIKDMIQIVLSNKKMFFAKEFETTYLICRFTILTIRIISATKHPEIDKELIPVFQKSLLRSIFTNIRKISNQNIVFQMLNIIVKFFKLDYTCIMTKPSYLDDVMPYAKKDFLYSFLSLLPTKIDHSKSQMFNPIYEYALKYGDQESINIASQYCINIFTAKDKSLISSEYHYTGLYQAWKNANLTNEDRQQMIATIPFYSDAFISNKTNDVHDTLSFNDVYVCIYNSISNDPDSVIIAFTVFQNSILKPNLSLDESKSLLTILMRCLSFNFMKDKIDKFSPIMLKYHSDLFLNGISNVFFLSLIETSSSSISYLSQSMNDLAITFMEIVISKDPDCPMIKQTVDQIQCVLHKTERIYSLITIVSILIRCCPKFVTVELIRSFILATNEVSFVDIFMSQSISDILEKYISVIDEETTQQFVDCIFNLFSTIRISFRIPILQILTKLKSNPPNYQLYPKSNFVCLELQKIMVTLLYDSAVNPSIIEHTKKCILDKNETASSQERLSRKFSLIYSTIANESNFAHFAEDQAFFQKLTNFINNSMISMYKELRKEAKLFLRIVLDLIDKKNKYINQQFENPSELYCERIDRFMYFKHLIKIKPELIKTKLILELINAIGSYMLKTSEEKSQYFTNLKMFFSFIGSKDITRIKGLDEGLISIIDNHTYLMHLIESFHRLLLEGQFPYQTIITKPTLNFLLNFPDKSLSYLIDSYQGLQFYTSYLVLIDFDESTPFHNQFITLCKNKYDPFSYPLHYFEIIVKMSTIKSCVENFDFLEMIDFIFNQIVIRFDNITNNLYFMLFRMITTLTNTFKFVEDINRFILLLRSLDLPLVFNSYLYRKIVKKCIKNTSQQFKIELIKYFINNPGVVKTAIYDKALQHLIKQTKEIPEDLTKDLWNFLVDSRFVSSINRLLQHNVPSDDYISKICNTVSQTMMESNTELIIHSVKLLIQLGKLDKLPPEIYWLYIKQSLYTFKFMDIPFSKYTFQMLKLMKDHFPNVPPEISDAFALFIHNKCNSIRETQRIIEILLCAPPLNSINCFSPIIILSSFLRERCPNKTELPPKASFDCILNVGIKYIALNEVPKDELDKYFSICYKYIELMVAGMQYSTFLDKLSNYMNDHEIPAPPNSLFNEIISEDNKFLLPSFISLCIFLKSQPEEYLKYTNLIKRALEYIKDSNDFINSVTLQYFTELVCKKEEYVNLVFSIYDYLMNSDNFKNEQKAFQIMFSIMKANVMNIHYEKMWDLLIEREKKEAYTYLNENEQIRYTKYIISKCVNHELFIVQSANVFLDSDKVSKYAKILLIENLATFVNNYNSDLIFNCVDKIERLGASIDRDFKSEIADILIEAARCSTYLYKLKYLRKLGLLVPKDKIDKLNFMFNNLPILSWRNDTLIFTLSVFATDLKKWLPILAFGNSYQSILSDFVVYFIREYLSTETIKLFSDFFSKVLSIENKSLFNSIINGLSYIFFSTNFPIHSKIYAKAEKEINHPEYMIDFLVNLSTFTDSTEYFLPHYMNDFIFGKFGYHCNVAERAAMSLTLLSKFNTADELYYQIESNPSNNSNKLFTLFKEINEDENRFWSYISKKNFYFGSAVDEINKTSFNFEEQNYQAIENLLNQAHEQLSLEFKKNMSFFKDELFASIETAIQIEKYLIQQKQAKSIEIPKVSLDLLLFSQTLNPFLLSMLSNFKEEIKGLLKLPQSQQPEIEFNSESPPILSIPSTYIKKFKKISGITTRGLFAVNTEQINDFLTSIKMSCPPCNRDLIKLSPILFEIYRISPSDDLFKAVYCSYSLLIHNSFNEPFFIRQQAGARLLLLLQVAKTKAHFDVIKNNLAIFEKKDFDIWRLWLLQLVILSQKNELRDLLLNLYVEMGYRALLYAKQMNFKEIENYLVLRIPPSLIPLEKLGLALDIVFANKGFDKDYDHVVYLLNQSFPFPLPLYKIHMTIYHMSGETKYLSDQLVLLTFSTSIGLHTPVLIQKYDDPKSARSTSLKTFNNSLYIMNLIIRFSYSTRTRNMCLSSPFLFEIGDFYLMTIINGETIYLKDLYDQATAEQEKRNSSSSLPITTTENNDNDDVDDDDSGGDISEFLLKFLAKKCSKFEFIVNRNSLLRSWSSQAIVRHIFSIGYPYLEKMALYLNQGIAPLLTIDYENNFLRDDIEGSSIRYSPNFYRLFGGEIGIPTFQIGIAAVAHVLIDNLESIRSYLEVLFFDRLGDEIKNIEIEEAFELLVKKRSEIENKILNLAPPSGRTASVDDLVEWMSGMDSLVEKAMNENIQPPAACPWF